MGAHCQIALITLRNPSPFSRMIGQEGDLNMSWQEGVAITVVLLGLGAGAFLVAQRPSFWIEFGSRVAKALLPLAWRFISKKMPPEEEAAWRESERRGQGDEWLPSCLQPASGPVDGTSPAFHQEKSRRLMEVDGFSLPSTF